MRAMPIANEKKDLVINRPSQYWCYETGDINMLLHQWFPVRDRVGTDIANVLGYKRLILKSDQEPAIKKLKAAVRREFSLEIPDEYSAVGDSQSNGEVEITVQVVEGQIRTTKCHLETG